MLQEWFGLVFSWIATLFLLTGITIIAIAILAAFVNYIMFVFFDVD